MTATKKKSPTKTPPAGVKTPMADAQKGAEKLSKAADQVFGKLKKHFDKKKVDAWQAKWLAVPANRKKYQKIADAPEVVGEELIAITNDIIDFVQGEEGGKSNILKKLKGGLSGFFKNPVNFVQKQAAQGRVMAEKAVDQAKKEAGKAKSVADKATKTVAKKAGKAIKK